MKNILVILTSVVICFLSGCSNTKDILSIGTIEKGFREIPDSIRVGCYWYWISDNISKEGVIKDLHAMKKAGITRAYIGNIDIGGNSYGEVKIFTPEWWEAVHAALKTATELDIEIGMFNSPGWSQSGGPWVKPEQSMRYLAATDMQVKGSTNSLIYSTRILGFHVNWFASLLIQHRAMCLKKNGRYNRKDTNP